MVATRRAHRVGPEPHHRQAQRRRAAGQPYDAGDRADRRCRRRRDAENVVPRDHLPGRHGRHDGDAGAGRAGPDAAPAGGRTGGGCIAWGGAARLSPADDVLIRVERPLDLDSTGQLVASVLSKKAAAGATHVLIDLPVGPTAKIRSIAEAQRCAAHLREVGAAVGLQVLPVMTDGAQPVGRGLGPALEAWDALAVLQGDAGGATRSSRAGAAPGRLRPRAGRCVGHRRGQALARRSCSTAAPAEVRGDLPGPGRPCVPPTAEFTRPFSTRPGRVCGSITAGSRAWPSWPARHASQRPGLVLHVRLGPLLSAGQPLFTVHARAAGELDYALSYARAYGDIIAIGEDR